MKPAHTDSIVSAGAIYDVSNSWHNKHSQVKDVCAAKWPACCLCATHREQMLSSLAAVSW